MSKNVLNDAGQSSALQTLASKSTASQSPPTPDLTDPIAFTALASALNGVAQSLLKYGQMIEAGDSEQTEHINQAEQDESAQSEESEISQEEEDEQATSAEQCVQFCYNPDESKTPAFCEHYGSILDGYRRGEFHDEVRCFAVPASAVCEERKLFDKYDCCRLDEFLDFTCDELSIIFRLLSCLNEDANLSSYELYQISETLSNPLEKLRELQAQLEAFDLVHVMPVPKQ